ncbi:MAG: Rpn family recombination-promoting nuclease/putative transposase [Deltaproteobacteria bacterium]|jgi:hypothetical protein|nr:Rpn family recombination-promoting nuclease/putative transposase [Deltaproteobacteria bacterium]
MADSETKIEPEIKPSVFSPALSNDALNNVFQSVEQGGAAFFSFYNAILSDAGLKEVDGIKSLTSQKFYTTAGARSNFLDVEAVFNTGAIVQIEFQMRRCGHMSDRIFTYGATTLLRHVKPGGKERNPYRDMPNVTVVSILNFKTPPKVKEYHLVGGCLYKSKTYGRWFNKLAIHNILLPVFKTTELDVNNPLHLWLTALTAVKDDTTPMKMIVEANPVLKSYYERGELPLH